MGEPTSLKPAVARGRSGVAELMRRALCAHRDWLPAEPGAFGKAISSSVEA